VTRTVRFALAALAVVSAGAAQADPILRLPRLGKGKLLGNDRESGAFGFAAELNAMAGLGAERQMRIPEIGQLAGGTTALSLRLGIVGEAVGGQTFWPLDYLVRVDAAEIGRVDGDQARDRPAAAANQVIDDAALWWRPHVAAQVIAGRFKVPFTRWRQQDRLALATAGVPFAVERVAPDRRWGLTFAGDLGALAYAAGAYYDRDWFEPRLKVEVDGAQVLVDPSRAGRAIYVVHSQWTPRAPIGADLWASPARDPWFDWLRLSLGAGALLRVRDGQAGNRLDVAINGNLTWRRLSAVAEGLFAAEAEVFELAAVAELGAMASDRAGFFLRGELESCLDRRTTPACRAGAHSSDGRGRTLRTAGTGATWFVTTDRRSKIALWLFVRRDQPGDFKGDGAVVELQTAL
jgi:hypothetical protein